MNRDDGYHIFLQGFDLTYCTGLSHAVVASGAIGSCIYGLIQRSPVDRRKTLLNFDIALTLIPAMLFGVSFVSGARFGVASLTSTTCRHHLSSF